MHDPLRRRIAMGVFVLGLGLAAAFAADEPASKHATPAERYQELLKLKENGYDDLSKAKTDEERKRFQSRLARLPLDFVELAEGNPKDPVAVEALIQTLMIVNGTAYPTGGPASPGARALALLMRDHVRSDRLGAVCQQVFAGFHRNYEQFLRAVMETNPHREVAGLACLSLAQFLNDRLHRLGVLDAQDGPEFAERFDRVFGKEYMEELKRQDRAAVAKEAEALFERAAEKYSDVTIPVTYFGSGGTIGEKANSELFQIRHLAVGKVAPEIEGEDQDQKRFKLTDYRGKVVLLDFWHHL